LGQQFGARGALSRVRKYFFFEKKKQKTFAFLATRSRFLLGAPSNEQEFFGSFLQKRTNSFHFPAFLCRVV
jgi:hypothetical protein